MKRSVVLAQRIVQLGSPPLYIHFAHKPGTIGRFAARLAGVPYGISCHAKDIWVTPPQELVPKLRDAEVVLTCTVAGKAELERHVAGATPVYLAYHGVDVEGAVARRAVLGPPRVLSVGRLVEKKGHDTLIRAAGLLRDRDVRFTLRIAGEGVEWPRLQRLVHELDLAGPVTFLGPLSPRELRAEYASAAVFALACRQLHNGDRDGLPNVVLEAMVHGLPVVSTTQAGVAEAVHHGRTGLLVQSEDPRALADALERVLAEPGLAEDLGATAQASVRERFDRRQLLPAVATALTQAGLILPPAPAPFPVGAPIPALAAA
jgi:glycosyltransferase involved in cell wall biosynthesis